MISRKYSSAIGVTLYTMSSIGYIGAALIYSLLLTLLNFERVRAHNGLMYSVFSDDQRKVVARSLDAHSSGCKEHLLSALPCLLCMGE